MHVISKIRRFLAGLPDDEMFTTCQLLAFGRRSAVDQALYRLVLRGTIHRLARGLFIKSGSKALLVTPLQAARRKAARFGNRIVEYARNTARRLGIFAYDQPNNNTTYSTSGPSSSFLFNGANGSVRIYFKRVSARKRELADTKTGDIFRSLWEIRKRTCTAIYLEQANSLLGRSDRETLPMLARLIPTWLHNRYPWRSNWTPPRTGQQQSA